MKSCIIERGNTSIEFKKRPLLTKSFCDLKNASEKNNADEIDMNILKSMKLNMSHGKSKKDYRSLETLNNNIRKIEDGIYIMKQKLRNLLAKKGNLKTNLMKNNPKVLPNSLTKSSKFIQRSFSATLKLDKRYENNAHLSPLDINNKFGSAFNGGLTFTKLSKFVNSSKKAQNQKESIEEDPELEKLQRVVSLNIPSITPVKKDLEVNSPKFEEIDFEEESSVESKNSGN